MPAADVCCPLGVNSATTLGLSPSEAGLSPVTMAVAWSRQIDSAASAIAGVTSVEQVPDVLAAADMILPKGVMDAIGTVSKEILYPMG